MRQVLPPFPTWGRRTCLGFWFLLYPSSLCRLGQVTLFLLLLPSLPTQLWFLDFFLMLLSYMCSIHASSVSSSLKGCHSQCFWPKPLPLPSKFCASDFMPSCLSSLSLIMPTPVNTAALYLTHLQPLKAHFHPTLSAEMAFRNITIKPFCSASKGWGLWGQMSIPCLGA